MESSVQTKPSHPRLRMAGGVVKALFKSPTKAAEVVLNQDGTVSVTSEADKEKTPAK
jgi:hypothetical protein